ncbi:MAG: hypothetical protein IJS53_03185 [Clostridia bacterium]|nr:hypothetical protein [Clostridia bacterium]
MKKIICLLLCLLLPAAAFAAPLRDMRESVLSEAELSTMRGWLDNAVRAALPIEYDENTYVGAYVYACVEDGGCYVLECDVYLEDGGDTLPQFAPDEALAWLCPATVCVRRAGNDYEMISCETGEFYAAARMVAVQTEQYALSLPEVFSANPQDVYDYSYYDETGRFIAGVRYRCEDAAGMGLKEYAEALVGESEGDMIVDVREELGILTAQASGMYVTVYAGAGVFHSLTLTYPEDREAEFTLYAEFMRNSFVIEGETNG